jgi:hypothetical protein
MANLFAGWWDGVNASRVPVAGADHTFRYKWLNRCELRVAIGRGWGHSRAG